MAAAPQDHDAGGAGDGCPAPLADALAGCRSAGDVRALIGRAILAVDARLSAQVHEILEAPRFRALEAAWRGLAVVVAAAGGAAGVKVKIFDQDWPDLSRDLNLGLDGRRSITRRNVVTRELDTPGGEPFGLLFVDHALSLSVEGAFDDFYTAQLLCDLGAAAACPVVLGLAPDFFGERDAAWLTDRRRIASILAGEEYRAWHLLRAHPNARFLGIAWPELLLRGRYEDADAGFPFHQWPSQAPGLWGHGGIAFLCTVIAEFRRCAWFGFLKMIGDAEGEGAVLALPDLPGPARTLRPAVARLRLTRGQGQFLSDQGLMPLCESLKSHALYFVGNRSVAECAGDPAAEVLTQVQSVLIGCRMVHYLKVLIRGLIGQIQSAGECELILNNWLEQYCASVAEAAPEVLARYPLRSARAEVRDGGRGAARFTCAITLRPQYQVDNMLGDIALATEVGPMAQRAA